MKIIPAIDIIEGRCVRLSQGDYRQKTVYNYDPVDLALQFEDAGIKHVHLVDLDGARSQHIVNQRTLYQIAHSTNLEIDFGGGIKQREDLDVAFDSGATKVTIGSVAATSPERFIEWLETFGNERLILGADAREGKISINGWQQSTGNDVIDFIRAYEAKGVKEVICTEVSKDGMLRGPAIPLYKEILKRSQVELIASGGVTTFEDLIHLKAIGCSGAIVGKAIYEDRISLKDLGSLC